MVAIFDISASLYKSSLLIGRCISPDNNQTPITMNIIRRLLAAPISIQLYLLDWILLNFGVQTYLTASYLCSTFYNIRNENAIAYRLARLFYVKFLSANVHPEIYCCQGGCYIGVDEPHEHQTFDSENDDEVNIPTQFRLSSEHPKLPRREIPMAKLTWKLLLPRMIQFTETLLFNAVNNARNPSHRTEWPCCQTHAEENINVVLDWRNEFYITLGEYRRYHWNDVEYSNLRLRRPLDHELLWVNNLVEGHWAGFERMGISWDRRWGSKLPAWQHV